MSLTFTMPNAEPHLVVIKETPFLFRPARLSDAAAVAALSAQIWEGEDYVPHVFKEWVADEKGQFTVVYDGERLAGFGKLTELGPTEWWLEGLRVDPAYRGRGVARAMHIYAVELFDQIGRGMLRLATNAENAPIHKISGETGFRLVSQHFIVEASALAADPALTLTPITPAELPTVQEWLANSRPYQDTAGLVEDDWVWLELSPRLHRWLEQGRLFWWKKQVGLVIMHLDEEDPERLLLNFVDGPANLLPAILAGVQTQAAEWGATVIKGKPLVTPDMAAALQAARWQVHEVQMRLYERPQKPRS